MEFRIYQNESLLYTSFYEEADAIKYFFDFRPTFQKTYSLFGYLHTYSHSSFKHIHHSITTTCPEEMFPVKVNLIQTNHFHHKLSQQGILLPIFQTVNKCAYSSLIP